MKPLKGHAEAREQAQTTPAVSPPMLGFLAHGVKVNEGPILTNKRKKSKPSEKETAEEVGDTRMQRRIKAQPQETAAYQALIDHKTGNVERASLADS